MFFLLLLKMEKYYKINKDQKENIQKNITKILFNEKKIVFAYLHGSFLKKRFRDVDIGIYINKDLSNEQILKYELHLEEEISTKINYPIDIRVLNKAPLSFRFSVIKNGIILFSKDESKRTDFECLSLVKYHDFNFYRNRYMRGALGIKI